MMRVLVSSLLTLVLVTPGAAAAETLTGREILRKVDDMWRGTSSAAVVTMRIKTEHWERTLGMKAYSKGKDLTLVRITAPKQEAGTATLKVEQSIWNYLPKTRRVIKIPSSMMMGSWMGSHFTNDDLVRESRLEEDYDFELEDTVADDGEPVYRLTLNPKPEAPVVWGKIVLEVAKKTLVPRWQEYYDEDGDKVRRAEFADVETIGDRNVAMTMRMLPLDKPDELTEIHYDKLLFDVEIDDAFFSIQNLQRR